MRLHELGLTGDEEFHGRTKNVRPAGLEEDGFDSLTVLQARGWGRWGELQELVEQLLGGSSRGETSPAAGELGEVEQWRKWRPDGEERERKLGFQPPGRL